MSSETATTEKPVEPQHERNQLLLHEAIAERHSTRLFLPRPVSDEVLRGALELASRSPSAFNAQTWRLYMVTGDALARLKEALVAAARAGPPPDDRELPAAVAVRRSETGRRIYADGWGLARADADGRRAAVLRNYDFFGAPAAAVVCMSRDLPGEAALSVGMHLQTFLLALTDSGVASCVEISVTGYGAVLREQLAIPDDLVVLVGVAIGYEDTDVRVNKLRTDRAAVDETTVFLRD